MFFELEGGEFQEEPRETLVWTARIAVRADAVQRAASCR